MAMEKQPFEDVSPIKNGDVPLLLMNIPVVYICILHSLLETVFFKNSQLLKHLPSTWWSSIEAVSESTKNILIHRYPLFSCMKKCLKITKKISLRNESGVPTLPTSVSPSTSLPLSFNSSCPPSGRQYSCVCRRKNHILMAGIFGNLHAEVVPETWFWGVHAGRTFEVLE